VHVSTAMDRSADPCDDFYQFACGGWISRNPNAQAPRAFVTLPAHTSAQVWKLIEQARDRQLQPRLAHDDTFRQLLALCSEVSPAGPRALLPMRPLVERIQAVNDLDAFMAVLGHLHASGIFILFQIGVVPDARDPTRRIISLRPGALGLPPARTHQEYDIVYAEGLKAYRQSVSRALLQLESDSHNSESADAIVELEGLLAAQIAPADARENPTSMYNPTLARTLEASTGLPWRSYVQAAGIPQDALLNIEDPGYLQFVAQKMRTTSLQDLRSYLIWTLYRQTNSWLPAPRITGSTAQRGSCQHLITSVMGQDLERSYVEQYNGREKVEAATAVWSRVRDAFVEYLESSDGLERGVAMAFADKIRSIHAVIGYPGQRPEEPPPEVVPGGMYENILAARRQKFGQSIRTLAEPGDRSHWGARSFTVAAAYGPQMNRIELPLAVLQPPLFKVHYPPEMSFGGLGTVVGHEAAHSIDPQGRCYGPNGEIGESIRDWTSMARREECLTTAFAQFERSPSYYSTLTASMMDPVAVDSVKTKDENFADIVGVAMAYRAYERSAYGPPEQVGGLSGAQLFFLSYAQLWCGESHPERKRYTEVRDVHAPHKARVNGVLSQLPSFSQAFECRPGTKMRAEPACAPL